MCLELKGRNGAGWFLELGLFMRARGRDRVGI